MKQISAVEWLINEIIAKDWWYLPESMKQDIIEQAKAMEKEQIMSAFEAAEKDCGRDFLHGDLYYNETFKSE